MKIVIADDEWLIREGLKSMLQEIDVNIENIFMVSNGEELIDLVMEVMPEIAFVDIRMPNMNGLEAIRRLKSLSQNTQFVILTGFSEFEYAKEAINIGVANYLLKPASIEEVGDTLNKLKKQSKSNMELLNGEFEKELGFIFNKLYSMKDSTNKFITSANFICDVFYIDGFLEEREKAEKQIEFYKCIRNVLSDSIDYRIRRALITLPDGITVIIGAWENSNENGKNTIYKYFKRIETLISQGNNSGLKVTLFKTELCTSFYELKDNIKEIEVLSSLRAVITNESVITLKKLKEYSNKELLEVSKIIMRLTQAYADGNYVEIVSCLKGVEFTKNLMDSDRVSIKKYLLYASGIEIPQELPVSEWPQFIENYAYKQLSNRESLNNYDVINEVKKYINNNYMKNISVGEISEKLGLTANYLSTLFHKKTGTTFLKYVTEIRMRKAKELLVLNNKKVQEVANAVGYYSNRHFTKLFKESFGYYPSQCAEKAKGN